MPNWTQENGESTFGIVTCPRCHGDFECGEVPKHACIGGEYEPTHWDYDNDRPQYIIVPWTQESVASFLEYKKNPRVPKRICSKCRQVLKT